MGLERDATEFLAAAKASGASFRASATLGRQDYRHLQKHFQRVEAPDALVRSSPVGEPPGDGAT